MLDPFASQLQSMAVAYPDLDLSPWTRTYCAVYEGARKLIYASDGDHALHDVVLDPGELRNLYASEVADASRMTEGLASWEAGLSPYDPALRQPNDGARGQKVGRGAAEGMTREECQQLVVLGYVDNVEDCVASEGGDAPSLAKDRCGPPPKPATQGPEDGEHG